MKNLKNNYFANRSLRSLYFVAIGFFILALVSIAMATYFYEDFNDLSKCDAVKTTGGWKVPDSTGYHRAKPPEERATAGWTDLTNAPQKVAISGDIAYCANIAGIVSVQISSGSQLNSTNLSGGNCIDIALSGGYAYVAATNLLSKVNLSGLTESGTAAMVANGVAVKGDYAYVGSGAGGLRSVNTSTMTSPSNATWGSCDARGVAIYGDFAIVADATNGAAVVDISDPTSLAYKATLALGSGGYFVAVSGTLAAVAAGDSIYILGLTEVSDGDANFTMNIIARLGSKGNADDCEFFEDKLMVADGDTGISVYYLNQDSIGYTYLMTTVAKNASGVSDKGVAKTEIGLLVVADSAGVQFLSTGDIQPSIAWAGTSNVGDAIALAYSNDYIFVSCQTTGLISVDISSIADTLKALDTLTGAPSLGIDAEGDKVYQCRGTASPNFRIIDASDPTSLSVESSTNIGSTVWDVDVVGNYAYLACTDGVRMVDVTDWSIDHTYTSEYPCVSILVDGSYVYIAEEEGGLLILGSSLLDSVGRYNTADLAWGLAKNGNFCYIGDKTGGLYKINVSDPANPDLTSSGWGSNPLDTSVFHGQPIAVNVYDDYLLVGLLESDDQDLKILKISDGTIAYSCPTGTWLSEDAVGVGNYVIMADYGNGIKAWHTRGDITDSLNTNTVLHSTKVNTGPFRYIHWRANNVQDSSDAAPVDTSTYRLLYGNADPASDTIVIMNNDYDPPDGPFGRSYFEIGNAYNFLFWSENIVEHRLYPTAADSVWSVDSIEIEYKSTAGLLRTASAGISYGWGDSAGITFDTSATIGIDPLDIPVSGEASLYWEIDSIEYSTVSLPYNEPVPELKLVASVYLTIEPPASDIISFIIDGEPLNSTRGLDAGEHTVLAIPAGNLVFPFRIAGGWSMISIPSTAPVDISEWGIGSAFYFEDGAYNITDTLEPGRGYFVWTPGKYQFIRGMQNFGMQKILQSGWNLVGGLADPVSVYSMRTSPDDAIATYCIYTLADDRINYDIVDNLVSKKAYWIFAFEPCTLFVNSDEIVMAKQSRKVIENIAVLKLSDSDNHQTLQIGFDSDGSSKYDDGLDLILPPSIPNSENLGYLRYSGPSGELSRDIRKPEDSWNLVITKKCKLTFGSDYRYGNLAISGSGIGAILHAGSSIELKRGTYNLYRTSGMMALTPTITAISDIYPNPFNSAVKITADLAQNSGNLIVYDIAGRTVRNFEISGVGRHILIWDGKDIDGNNVPSGVYFAKFLADGDCGNPMKLLLLR